MTAPTPADLARLAQQLAASESFTTTAEEVVEAVRDVTGVADVGITLIRPGGRLRSISPTTEAVVEADRAQYDLNDGPCVDAAVDSLVLWSGDLATDHRWPLWCRRAVEIGFRSILSVNLHAGDRKIGGVNVYGRKSAEFDVQTAEVVRELAQHAAIALAHAGQIESLNAALATRHLIGQAHGILMERHHIDAERAFAVLRRYSQDRDIRLRAVAEALIRTSHLPGARPRSLTRYHRSSTKSSDHRRHPDPDTYTATAATTGCVDRVDEPRRSTAAPSDQSAVGPSVGQPRSEAGTRVRGRHRADDRPRRLGP